METIEDITREMRVELDQSWWDIDREKIHDMPDRLDAAYKWLIEGLNDGIVERDEYIAKLTSENARLKAALKPVLAYDAWQTERKPSDAVNEARRIYNGGVK